MTNITNISDKSSFSYTTFFIFFPLIVASLSVVAYQQAQVQSTTVNCTPGRFYTNASSCQLQVANILLPKSTAPKP